MTYEILIGALGLIGLLAGVIKPLIMLNQNITELTMSVNSLKDILNELKARVDTHGGEIDDLRIAVADHEARIKALEK